MPSTKPDTRVERRRRLVERYRQDPVFFAAAVLGVELWSKQRQILEALAESRRVAVRSAHGVGKTWTAAVAVLWALRKSDARVITTAPTWTQVRSLLWHEIRALHRGARLPLGGEVLQAELRMPDGRYALGLTTRPEEAERFHGHHAENLLVVFDEASGIPQAIYDAAEGYMTTPGAKMLLIGNPTRPEGTFHQAFHARREEFETVSISAFDLPWRTGERVSQGLSARLTSEQWVEEARTTFGEGSPLWDVKVLGQFPRQADDAVCALADVEEAQAKNLETGDPRIVACDVARFGSDETVVATRRGPVIRIARTHRGKDLMQTCGAIVEVAKTLTTSAGEPPRIVVDDVGLGGGVTDRLREQGHRAEAFNAGERSTLDYPNKRSEAWFAFSERLEELDLDEDRQLAADLTAPRYSLDSSGRRKVEPKEETKKRLGRSPDRADAVLMTLQATGRTKRRVRSGGYELSGRFADR